MNRIFAITIPAALWAVAFGLPVEAQPPVKRTMPLPSPLAGLIESADADKDGTVSRAELAAIDVFAKLDTNQDGKLDSSDVDHLFVFRAPPGAFLLRAADEDQDGKLTKADWQAFFAKADADGDGLLQRAELRSFMPAPPVPPVPPTPPEAPRAPEAPGAPGTPAPVGGIARPPMPPKAPMPPLPPEPPELSSTDLAAIFDRFDTNKDGQLDGDELPPARHIWHQRISTGG